MQDFKIFTEGKSDVKFIKDYVSEHFSFDLMDQSHIDVLGSHNGYLKDGILKESIRRNFDDGSQTILILDADNDFGKRQTSVLKDYEGFGIDVHLFLFPNNSSNGNLEVLLSKITVELKLIDCFDAYEKCIEGYNLPVDKAKIFAYLEALLPPKNRRGDHKDLIQPENRNYRNPAHWNLHHDYLQPFNTFLSPFFN